MANKLGVNLLAALLMTASPAFALQVFKWTDLDGATHYSDRPPAVVAAPPARTHSELAAPRADRPTGAGAMSMRRARPGFSVLQWRAAERAAGIAAASPAGKAVASLPGGPLVVAMEVTASQPTPASGERGRDDAQQPVEAHVVMDFEDPVLHDKSWLLDQASSRAHAIVAPKSDSGADELSIAIGEGRGGGNALLVESRDAAMGLPGFWVLMASNEGGAATPGDESGYVLPRGKRANRLEFWVRFQPGFRARDAAAQPPVYPNHVNLHVGTYHFDPARIGGGTEVKESDNWHFYHQLFVRHDEADGEWIHVVLNELPQHQRAVSSQPPVNPTLPAGNYWELLTRFYVDNHAYFADPGIDYPVKMWVDDIRLTRVEESAPVSVSIDGKTSGGTTYVYRDEPTALGVSLVNASADEVCGALTVAVPDAVHARLASDDRGADAGGDVCIAPRATRRFSYVLRPKADLKYGSVLDAGVIFSPRAQMRSDATSANRSLSDPNVEKRWQQGTGPHDGSLAGAFVRMFVK